MNRIWSTSFCLNTHSHWQTIRPLRLATMKCFRFVTFKINMDKTWPFPSDNHVMLVQRMLGSSQLGTGGSSGYFLMPCNCVYSVFLCIFKGEIPSSIHHVKFPIFPSSLFLFLVRSLDVSILFNDIHGTVNRENIIVCSRYQYLRSTLSERYKVKISKKMSFICTFWFVCFSLNGYLYELILSSEMFIDLSIYVTIVLIIITSWTDK